MTLNGVTVATMNNRTVKARVAARFAAYFKVWTSQINITAVAPTGSRRLLTEPSCTLIVTILNMSPAQAAVARDVLNTPNSLTQLTQVVAQAGPAVLASVTVASVQEDLPAPTPTLRPTSKFYPANQVPTPAGGGTTTTIPVDQPSAGSHAGHSAVLLWTGLVIAGCSILTSLSF